MSNRKIRTGMFETNSSSAHSFTIDKSFAHLISKPFTDEEMKKGIVKVWGGVFNWEIEEYDDVRTKLSYLFTNAASTLKPNQDANKAKNKRLSLLRKAVKKHTGCDLYFIEDDDSYSRYGYIDHQSLDIFDDLWEKGTTDWIIKFLFSPKSILRIDNDNY